MCCDSYSVEPIDEEADREAGSDSEVEIEDGGDGSDEDDILGVCTVNVFIHFESKA